MRKRTMRSFALGLLASASLIGAAYYLSPPTPPTEQEVKAFLKQHGLIAIAKDEYDQLRRTGRKVAATPTPKPSRQTVYVYRLVIEKGDTPESFAKELESAGVIDSARSFNDYLQQRGLARSIRPGTYTVRSDMDYAAISRLIAGP
ncbi:aminodeoxychorismate lyase [Geobacillus sp. YF-1]|uniref:aminodeoxychorismate lyase n=1 Tax=Geobacillus sp. YF-1 TaxID=3457480 RepID=UPI0040452DA6